MFMDLSLLSPWSVDLEWHRDAYVGDSSGHGYCLLRSAVSLDDVWHDARLRERWRFLEVDADVAYPTVRGEVLDQLGGLRPLGGQAGRRSLQDPLFDSSEVIAQHDEHTSCMANTGSLAWTSWVSRLLGFCIFGCQICIL